MSLLTEYKQFSKSTTIIQNLVPLAQKLRFNIRCIERNPKPAIYNNIGTRF